ncbi:MAG: CBS domain-containing protein [Candidatus Woesearchaeota archaeon]
MPFDISEIKPVRKRLGLTQNELASIAGVSQSLVAKIEAGTLDPTYSNAKKLFNAIESFSRKKETSVEEIMTKRLVYVRQSDSARDAIKKMKAHEISQMPVIDDGKPVGLISEAILLDAMLNNEDRIDRIMQDSPPVLSTGSSVKAVSDLLRYCPLVLIGEKGKLKGIVTKSDLLRKVYNK